MHFNRDYDSKRRGVSCGGIAWRRRLRLAQSALQLRLWILPQKRDVSSHYERKHFSADRQRDRFLTVVAPNDPEALWINQNAFLSLTDLSPNAELIYSLHLPENGAYFFVVEGQTEIDGQKLKSRDALGLWNRKEIPVRAHAPTQMLAIEVPMI